MLRIFLASRVTRDFWSDYIKCLALTFIVVGSLRLPETRGFETGRGGNKGIYCKNNEDCDQIKLLSCEGNACGCRKAVGLIWVPEESSCMIMEGAMCGRREQTQQKCIRNSTCERGKCECDDGFLRDGFGHCELSYGSPCSESEPCAKRYLLQCDNENGKAVQPTCICQGEGIDFVWDELKSKCVSTSGGTCDIPDEKSQYEMEDDKLECIANSKCMKFESGTNRGICECDQGFTPSDERTCLLEYGQRCQDHSECSGSLICRDKKCDCKFLGQMQYDEEDKKCKSLVGEPCNVFNVADGMRNATKQFDNKSNIDVILECGKDAVCQRRRGSSNGKCECLPSFEVSDGKCTKYRGHGQPCSVSVECDTSKFLECVYDENYVGWCDCQKNQMVYDGMQKRCIVPPGKSCLKNKRCSENAYCDGEWCNCDQSRGYVIELYPHSRCVRKVKNNDEMNLFLKSQATSPHPTLGTVVDDTDTTSFKIDMPLTSFTITDTSCDDINERSLEWKKCQCQLSLDTHMWLSNETSCVALVGTSCTIDSDCVPHATCHPVESVCQCSHHTITTKSLTCYTPLGNNHRKIFLDQANTNHNPNGHHDDIDHHRQGRNQELQTLPSIKVKNYFPEADTYSSSGSQNSLFLRDYSIITTIKIDVILSVIASMSSVILCQYF